MSEKKKKTDTTMSSCASVICSVVDGTYVSTCRINNQQSKASACSAGLSVAEALSAFATRSAGQRVVPMRELDACDTLLNDGWTLSLVIAPGPFFRAGLSHQRWLGAVCASDSVCLIDAVLNAVAKAAPYAIRHMACSMRDEVQVPCELANYRDWADEILQPC